jgi:uncharacterized membrane protein YedE/YeeE
MNSAYLSSFFGGILIGIAVTIMLLFNGRVTGISGIIGGALSYVKKDWLWRFTFFLGLALGGLVLRVMAPEALANQSNRNLGTIIVAGLLVGYGTLLANGCTSGHGVCGISRFSVRSILATVTFILFGAVSVFIMRRFMEGSV